MKCSHKHQVLSGNKKSLNFHNYTQVKAQHRAREQGAKITNSKYKIRYQSDTLG
ncbi:MAG: hypothetical protein F6J93_37895 [Oscillatoria sp. SIO1A7]|nr:hypothetical protein [Oscillatoria sp. SIO1A7]